MGLRLSGLIFFILIAGLSTNILDSLLARQMGLERSHFGHIWRGKVLEGHYNADIIVKQTENGIQIIVPDSSVPRETCERLARKLASKIYSLVKQVELPPEFVSISSDPITQLCAYCFERLSYLGYRCRRCRGIYCKEHRLPERHDCPGYPRAQLSVVVKRRFEEPPYPRYDEVVILNEAPCG
jgi:hypothetical protein